MWWHACVHEHDGYNLQLTNELTRISWLWIGCVNVCPLLLVDRSRVFALSQGHSEYKGCLPVVSLWQCNTSLIKKLRVFKTPIFFQMMLLNTQIYIYYIYSIICDCQNKSKQFPPCMLYINANYFSYKPPPPSKCPVPPHMNMDHNSYDFPSTWKSSVSSFTCTSTNIIWGSLWGLIIMVVVTMNKLLLNVVLPLFYLIFFFNLILEPLSWSRGKATLVPQFLCLTIYLLCVYIYIYISKYYYEIGNKSNLI